MELWLLFVNNDGNISTIHCKMKTKLWYFDKAQLCLIFHFAKPMLHPEGLVQDCSISIALAMEIPQSCTKPSIYSLVYTYTKIKCIISLILPCSLGKFYTCTQNIFYVLTHRDEDHIIHCTVQYIIGSLALRKYKIWNLTVAWYSNI